MTKDHPNGEAPKGTLTAPRLGTESAGLTDSLRRFREQTPQESLGLPAGNNLLKPFLQATVISLAVFAALTLFPYLYDKANPPPAKPGAPAKTDSSEPAAPTPPSTDPNAKAPTPIAGTPGKAPAGKKDIVDVLGENGSRTTSPKVNPLDRRDDDLFKDIK